MNMRIQPFMFQPHPAYRMQIEVLRRTWPEVVQPVYPVDRIEHARLVGGITRAAMIKSALQLQMQRWNTRDHELGYVSGTFPPALHFLAKSRRVHVDADDPLSVYVCGGRDQLPGMRFRRYATAFCDAMKNETLTLSFWTLAQLKNFVASLVPDEWEGLFDSGRLCVLPPAIIPNAQPAAIGMGRSLRCLIIANGKFWLKGVPDAISAVHLLVREGAPIELTVVGSQLHPEWKAFLKRHSHFHLHGFITREELRALFLQHDVLLFPSHHDTYGWSILEAKSFGLPTIATDFYTRPEIIEHERDGLLVPDPFNNPFMPVVPIAYAAPYLRLSAQGDIVVHPLMSGYIDQLKAAIVRCHTQRESLMSLGRHAYSNVTGHGKFGLVARQAILSKLVSL